MDPSTVAALLDDAARCFALADDLEITLEANPTSIEAGRLAELPRCRGEPDFDRDSKSGRCRHCDMLGRQQLGQGGGVCRPVG